MKALPTRLVEIDRRFHAFSFVAPAYPSFEYAIEEVNLR